MFWEICIPNLMIKVLVIAENCVFLASSIEKNLLKLENFLPCTTYTDILSLNTCLQGISRVGQRRIRKILWLINAASGKETQQTQIPPTALAAFLCMPQAQINFPIERKHQRKRVGRGGGVSLGGTVTPHTLPACVGCGIKFIPNLRAAD